MDTDEHGWERTPSRGWQFSQLQGDPLNSSPCWVLPIRFYPCPSVVRPRRSGLQQAIYTGVKSRVAEALRLAAQSLWQAKNYFGDLFRRWKARLGSPKAITAMAHKLARVLWHLLKFKEPFKPEVFAKEEEKMQRKKLARLQNLATALNYHLVPNQ